jgi:Carbohydrate esterase, sialic acid-specific acetylesterase
MKFLKQQTFLFLFLIVSSYSQAQSNGMYIVLLAGQSNMAGRGVIRPAIDTVSYPNIFCMNRDSVWVRAKNPLHYDKPEAAVGMGISFAHELALKLGGNVKIGLVPCAAGGTIISQWLTNYYFPVTSNSTGNYYLYDNLIKRAKKAAQSGKIIGMIWHQGESDATDASYPTYQNNLKTFFEKVRTDLKAPNLPIVAGELGRFLVKSKTYTRGDSINNIINSLKLTLPFYDVASSEGLLAQDGVHFTSDSQVVLGKRYAGLLFPMIVSKITFQTPE